MCLLNFIHVNHSESEKSQVVVHVDVTYDADTLEIDLIGQISQSFAEYVFEIHGGRIELNGVEFSVEEESTIIIIDLRGRIVKG